MLTASEKKKLYYEKNKELVKARNKQRRAEGKRVYNPVTERKQKLRSTYGLQWDEYLQMYDDQLGKCAICKKDIGLDANHKTDRPYVDHCHESGKNRGLLCMHCNTGIGHFKDRVDVLAAAIEYLNAYK